MSKREGIYYSGMMLGLILGVTMLRQVVPPVITIGDVNLPGHLVHFVGGLALGWALGFAFEREYERRRQKPREQDAFDYAPPPEPTPEPTNANWRSCKNPYCDWSGEVQSRFCPSCGEPLPV